MCLVLHSFSCLHLHVLLNDWYWFIGLFFSNDYHLAEEVTKSSISLVQKFQNFLTASFHLLLNYFMLISASKSKYWGTITGLSMFSDFPFFFWRGSITCSRVHLFSPQTSVSIDDLHWHLNVKCLLQSKWWLHPSVREPAIKPAAVARCYEIAGACLCVSFLTWFNFS